MSKFLPAIALVLLVPFLTAGKKRQAAPLVSFHLDATDEDRPRDTTRVVIGTATHRVNLKPSFSQSDITGFYPFLAEDGRTFGTAFKLKERSAKKLQSLSAGATGRKIFTVAGTDAVSFVVFDGAIDDGYILCWKGLTRAHIDAFKAAGFQQIEPEVGAATPDSAPGDEPLID